MTALILPHHGKYPVIHDSAFIAPNAVVIGDVEIGPDSSIWFGCVVRGDVNVIRIGARTNIQDGTIIHVAARGQGTFIGDGVTVGHMALLHACTVESGAFIGMKSCVMDGVVVESGAVVAAGALVTPGKRVLKGQVWAGNPARYLRDVTPTEVETFALINQGYVELPGSYRSA
jgi:gamma-carbonic anhydrase